MKYSARIVNGAGKHQVSLARGESRQTLEIAPRSNGQGSSVSGGEALSLALATCYCNDIYREAGKRGIQVQQVEVEVDSEFEQEGEPSKGVVFRARVTADAGEQTIRELMQHTDTVSEIQNTLRYGVSVELVGVEAVSQKS